MYNALRDERIAKRLNATEAETLAKQIEGVGLPGLGGKRCAAVAARFGTGEALRAATTRDLARVELGSSAVNRTVGTVAAESLRTYFDTPKTRALLERLRDAGVNTESLSAATSTGAAGKVFVLTGSLPSGLPRPDAKKMIEAAGGRVSGSVGKSIDYLVAGEKAGSKLDKARTLGLAIIDEAELRRLCGTE